MSTSTIKFTIDGKEITATEGQTIMEAADAAGVYIPRLCDHKGLRHQGSCRVCTVKVDGWSAASCTEPARDGASVDSETADVKHLRADLVAMLFLEGNHLCPICEASGNCELQAMAYRMSESQPTKFPNLTPNRPVDASHPDIALDTNRCITCGRCVRASNDVDGKGVFGYVGRGIKRQLTVDGTCLADTSLEATDAAVQHHICPVGCIIRKGEGFAVPIGQRVFDTALIGSDIEGQGDE